MLLLIFPRNGRRPTLRACNSPTKVQIKNETAKKKFIKILNSLGISDWKSFLYNYTANDTQLMMDEFEKRGWRYKKITILF